MERITAKRLTWIAAILALIVALMPFTDFTAERGEDMAFRITVEMAGVIFVYDSDSGVTIDGTGVIPDGGGDPSGGGGGGAG